MGRDPADSRRARKCTNTNKAQPASHAGAPQTSYALERTEDDDAFQDFSDCQPRPVGGVVVPALEPDPESEPEPEPDRYSRTAAWVEDFHDGWDALDLFTNLEDADFTQIPSQQSATATYLPDLLDWDAAITSPTGTAFLGAGSGSTTPWHQVVLSNNPGVTTSQHHHHHHHHHHDARRDSSSAAPPPARPLAQQQDHRRPRCQVAAAAARLDRQEARLECLTEEMRRFTREHGVYVPGQ